MPGILKRVRFSRTNTVHGPPTPALTVGSLSPASSAGLITPPQYPPAPLPSQRPGSTPYHSIPPPRPSKSYTMPAAPALEAHHYLERSAIHYDLLDPPTYASRHQQPLPHYRLDEPATTPPLPAITLKSDVLPWHIRIVRTRRSYVTVGDVLDQLYNALRTNISQPDYDVLHSSMRKQITWAYERRYQRLHGRSGYHREKSSGVKRVDFLMGHTKFMGLSRTKAYDVWILNTG